MGTIRRETVVFVLSFSLSNDDTVTNGIALSPSLHRSFDRGLIHITKEYQVKVSPLVKDKNSNFTLTQFKGNDIILPKKEFWFPLVESLTWQQENVFIK